MPHFLFPSDPLDSRAIDESFTAQRDALVDAGHTASLVSDRVLEGRGRLVGVPPASVVVYRGWMVNLEQYANLQAAITAAGASGLTSEAEYRATHHLPNWYALLSELTPSTRVFSEDDDLVGALRGLSWPAFFIKDYVKSLKTSIGSLITDPACIPTVVAEMRKFRGEIEGGVCVRQVEPFLKETEQRYFVLAGKPFASPHERAIPLPVRMATERIPSPFFTVDVAERSDGIIRIVELGDGQVSDLVGWSISDFVGLWNPGAKAA